MKIKTYSYHTRSFKVKVKVMNVLLKRVKQDIHYFDFDLE